MKRILNAMLPQVRGNGTIFCLCALFFFFPTSAIGQQVIFGNDEEIIVPWRWCWMEGSFTQTQEEVADSLLNKRLTDAMVPWDTANVVVRPAMPEGKSDLFTYPHIRDIVLGTEIGTEFGFETGDVIVNGDRIVSEEILHHGDTEYFDLFCECIIQWQKQNPLAHMTGIQAKQIWWVNNGTPHAIEAFALKGSLAFPWSIHTHEEALPPRINELEKPIAYSSGANFSLGPSNVGENLMRIGRTSLGPDLGVDLKSDQIDSVRTYLDINDQLQALQRLATDGGGTSSQSVIDSDLKNDDPDDDASEPSGGDAQGIGIVIKDFIVGRPGTRKMPRANSRISLEEVQVNGLGYWDTKPAFTVGETIFFNFFERNESYTPPGLIDGIGAMTISLPNNREGVRIFVSHSIQENEGASYLVSGSVPLTGARISYFDFDRETRDIARAGIAYDRIIDENGAEVDSGTQITPANDPSEGFRNFSSGSLFEAGTLNLEDTIYFTGEETDGGLAYALNPESSSIRTLYALPWLGRASWKNITLLDPGNPEAIAMLINDSRAGAPLLLYVGNKLDGGEFLERNGLSEGNLFVWVADSGIQAADFNGTGNTRSGRFEQISINNGSTFLDQENQDMLTELAGAFQFAGLQDASVNPEDSTQAVVITSGMGSVYPDDSWGTTYLIDVNFESLSNITADLTILYDGDDAGGGQFESPDTGLRNPGNLDWADNERIYIQEARTVDNSSFGDINQDEASTWELNLATGGLIRVSSINRNAQLPVGQTDPLQDDLGNWETAGILDVTSLFEVEDGEVLLLGSTQAHSVTDGVIETEQLVEGGQLFFSSLIPRLEEDDFDPVVNFYIPLRGRDVPDSGVQFFVIVNYDASIAGPLPEELQSEDNLLDTFNFYIQADIRSTISSTESDSLFGSLSGFIYAQEQIIEVNPPDLLLVISDITAVLSGEAIRSGVISAETPPISAELRFLLGTNAATAFNVTSEEFKEEFSLEVVTKTKDRVADRVSAPGIKVEENERLPRLIVPEQVACGDSLVIDVIDFAPSEPLTLTVGNKKIAINNTTDADGNATVTARLPGGFKPGKTGVLIGLDNMEKSALGVNGALTITECSIETPFTLIDADLDTPVTGFSPIFENATLDLAELPFNLNIVVKFDVIPDRVEFELDGLVVNDEISVPFSLFGDVNGDFNSGVLATGSHVLKVTPFIGESEGEAFILPFDVVNSDPIKVTGFFLVDADTNVEFIELKEGGVYDISSWPASINVDARANAGVKSVLFDLNRGLFKRLENVRPYALFGDIGSSFNPANLPVGTYTLTVTPYPEWQAAGQPGTALSITFTLTGSTSKSASIPTGYTEEPLDGLQGELPTSYELKANYPNPFNPVTTIGFNLPEMAPVQVSVYDVLGRRVAVLVDEVLIPGQYHIQFDADSLPSGVYFYNLVTPNRMFVQKMLLMK